MTRAATIAGARRLLDMLEAHPDVPLPWHLGGAGNLPVPTTIYTSDPTTYHLTCVALGMIGDDDVTIGGPDHDGRVLRTLTTTVDGLVVHVVQLRDPAEVAGRIVAADEMPQKLLDDVRAAGLATAHLGDEVWGGDEG